MQRQALGAMGGSQAYALARQRRRPMLHVLILALILFGVLSSSLVSSTFPFQLRDSAPIAGLSLPNIGSAPREGPILTSAALPNTVRREEMQEALAALAGGAVVFEEPSAAAEVEVGPAPPPQFQLYQVQEGDTASDIATRFGVDLQYLLWNNVELQDGNFLRVGQTIIIPAGNGILYYLRYGETLSDVAVRFDVTLEEITSWPGNAIDSPDRVNEDQLVYVRGGVPTASLIPEPSAPAEDALLVEGPPPAEPAPPPPAAAPPPAPAPALPASSAGLIWPVSGPLSQYFSGGHPAIDIDMYGSPYAPVGAATSGTVAFAGGNPCCSYGYHVIVVSPEGIETLYGHLSSVAVGPGQQVSQGEYLGNVGCTGFCTGNHLHFGVMLNGVSVNPVGYLP